jgi:hypothetical protein
LNFNPTKRQNNVKTPIESENTGEQSNHREYVRYTE